MSYLARGPIPMGIDSKANGMPLPTRARSIFAAVFEATTMSYLARGPIPRGIDSKANGMRCEPVVVPCLLQRRRQQP